MIIVTFGRYEQGKGVIPIEWIPLQIKEKETLLVSKYALDCRRYNEKHGDVTWETCSLRAWLNGEFYDTAFNDKEKALIAETIIPADKNPWKDTDPGNATRDRVFLLSALEIQRCFSDGKNRICAPTDYAKKRGAFASGDLHTTEEGEEPCWWWLRTPGNYPFFAERISDGGDIDYCGGFSDQDEICVRPAIWIKL